MRFTGRLPGHRPVPPNFASEGGPALLIDARTLPNNHLLQTDVCIIGAGAAGIALATEFASRPFRVLVLESGALEPDAETQSLYRGTNLGLPYFPLEVCRLRYFGGTTNHWGGTCIPFDAMDFEKHQWIPNSGWPFLKSTVDPFYPRALAFVPLRHVEWDPHYWAEPDKPLLSFASRRVTTVVGQQAVWRSSRFGITHRDTVTHAPNITVCLHANATQFEADPTLKRVTRLHGASLSQNRFAVKARLFILAAGAIENARLLLLSNTRYPAGLGNQNGLVGRFFMEHPIIPSVALFKPSNPQLPMRFYHVHTVKRSLINAGLSLSQEVRREERLTSVNIGLETFYDGPYERAFQSQGLRSFHHLLKRLRRAQVPDEFSKHLSNVISDVDDLAVAAYGRARFGDNYPIDRIKLSATLDPVPNPDSRVTLGPQRDQLGQRRVQLDWRLTPLDNQSLHRTLEIMGLEFGRAGLGRLQITIDDRVTALAANVQAAYHHMGTTRMHDDPKQGVVDKNCLVHGLQNLFIAGSSVFPTAGSGTPTVMIVALAFRLADHVKREMQ